jgi:hypothetical protein
MVRDKLVTLPDRLKLAWRAMRDWWTAAILRWIDRYLQARDEERAPALLGFEELAVLYDETDIPILFDEAGGWAGNSWPAVPEPIDYGDSDML